MIGYSQMRKELANAYVQFGKALIPKLEFRIFISLDIPALADAFNLTDTIRGYYQVLQNAFGMVDSTLNLISDLSDLKTFFKDSDKIQGMISKLDELPSLV